MAYAAIEPFGPEADDLRHGIACATVVNSNSYRKRGSPMIEPKTFMLSRADRSDDERQSTASMRAALRSGRTVVKSAR